YENGRVVQAAPRAELLWQPASETVAKIMGLRNVLRGSVVKAAPDRIQLSWRGQTLEAVNSPTRSYLPPPESPIAFFIRPEYVRLIRKDRGAPDVAHHMNMMRGTVVGEADFGTVWSLRLRLDTSGAPAQGDFDLEVEVPHLVYEILEIERDWHWGSRSAAARTIAARASSAGSSGSRSRRSEVSGRERSREARRSAWRWRARSCSSPRCSCSTSRSPGSTRPRAPISCRRSWPSCVTIASPPCS